jgi:hypothetical protein
VTLFCEATQPANIVSIEIEQLIANAATLKTINTINYLCQLFE